MEIRIGTTLCLSRRPLRYVLQPHPGSSPRSGGRAHVLTSSVRSCVAVRPEPARERNEAIEARAGCLAQGLYCTPYVESSLEVVALDMLLSVYSHVRPGTGHCVRGRIADWHELCVRRRM